MQIGLDIGRQYAKIVVLEKLRDGVKLLNYDNSRIPETNKPFDPENIDNHLIIMAVKDLIKKLNLKPNQKILDIGSGWGSLAIDIAKKTQCEVTGITLSENQYNYSINKAKDETAKTYKEFRLSSNQLDKAIKDEEKANKVRGW